MMNLVEKCLSAVQVLIGSALTNHCCIGFVSWNDTFYEIESTC